MKTSSPDDGGMFTDPGADLTTRYRHHGKMWDVSATPRQTVVAFDNMWHKSPEGLQDRRRPGHHVQ